MTLHASEVLNTFACLLVVTSLLIFCFCQDNLRVFGCHNYKELVMEALT